MAKSKQVRYRLQVALAQVILTNVQRRLKVLHSLGRFTDPLVRPAQCVPDGCLNQRLIVKLALDVFRRRIEHIAEGLFVSVSVTNGTQDIFREKVGDGLGLGTGPRLPA